MDNRDNAPVPDGETKELCSFVVAPSEREMDPQLAAALRESAEAFAKDPDRWHNNPEKKRKAIDGLGRVLAEWEEENGAFTEEEMARPRALIYGADVRS